MSDPGDPVETAAPGLCQLDRELLDLWTQNGAIPNEPSTVDASLRLLLKLWAAYKTLEDCVGELTVLLDGFLCRCGDALDDAHRPGGKCGNCLAADDAPACPGEPHLGYALHQPGKPDSEPVSPAEEKVVDLMAALEESVREANEARDRHVARPVCTGCGYRDGHESGCPDDPRSWADG